MSAGIAKPANPSAHVDPKSAPLKEIPDVLVDPRTMKRYARGRFLGKGGFAKCYEITDMETKQVFAGKIVPKSLILKQHQREKMTSEIAIHKSLDHANVVGFHGFFENDDFVFVVLEICRRRVSVCVCVRVGKNRCDLSSEHTSQGQRLWRPSLPLSSLCRWRQF